MDADADVDVDADADVDVDVDVDAEELTDALDSAAANCRHQRVSGLSFRHPQVFCDVFCVAFS